MTDAMRMYNERRHVNKGKKSVITRIPGANMPLIKNSKQILSHKAAKLELTDVINCSDLAIYSALGRPNVQRW